MVTHQSLEDGIAGQLVPEPIGMDVTGDRVDVTPDWVGVACGCGCGGWVWPEVGGCGREAGQVLAARVLCEGFYPEKEYVKAAYCHPAYLTSMQSTS